MGPDQESHHHYNLTQYLQGGNSQNPQIFGEIAPIDPASIF